MAPWIPKQPSRRRFLAAGLGAVAAGTADRAFADNPKNLPPNVPQLDARARRRRCGAPLRQAVEIREARGPPRRGMAHGEPRVVGELHAAARARRHHHAQRPVLRAPPRRHRRDRSAGLPADRARPRRQAANAHARGPETLSARQPHLLPRMRGELRHGMARRAAQRLPIHPRHGALRRIHRRAAEDPAGGSGRSRPTPSGCSPRAPTPPP